MNKKISIPALTLILMLSMSVFLPLAYAKKPILVEGWIEYVGRGDLEDYRVSDGIERGYRWRYYNMWGGIEGYREFYSKILCTKRLTEGHCVLYKMFGLSYIDNPIIDGKQYEGTLVMDCIINDKWDAEIEDLFLVSANFVIKRHLSDLIDPETGDPVDINGRLNIYMDEHPSDSELVPWYSGQVHIDPA